MIPSFLRFFGFDLTFWGILELTWTVLAIVTIPSVISTKNGRPLAALSWILALFALPFVGIFFWWLAGRNHLKRKRRKRQISLTQTAGRLEQLQRKLPDVPPASPMLAPISHLPGKVFPGSFPASSENQVEIIGTNSQFYDELEKSIRNATHHIHLLFYIWETNAAGIRFRDLLIEKARAGVKVRVLIDGIGSFSAQHSFMDPLRAAGAQVASFLPPKITLQNLTVNFRNHRKLVIFDGKSAYVSSANIGDTYLHQWEDVSAKLQGSVIDAIQEVFAEDWYFSTHEDLFTAEYFGCWSDLPKISSAHSSSCVLIASGPDVQENPLRDACFIAMNQAQKRIWIVTPYFIPDETVRAALRSALLRGVDVRVLIPATSDVRLARLAGRAYYRTLLNSGIRIFEYQPGVLHSKILLFDSSLSALGSANVDSRSFHLNFEANVFISNATVNDELARKIETYFSQSHEVQLTELKKQTTWRNFLEGTAHLLSPLL